MATANETPVKTSLSKADKSKLLGALGITAKDAAPAKADLAGMEVDSVGGLGGQGKSKVESPTYLEQDKWSLRRGKELLDAEDFELGKLNIGDDESKPMAAADFWSAAFSSSPEPVEDGCHDKLRSDYLKDLMQSDDFASLRRQTCLDDFAASVAAKSFACNFAKLREEAEKLKKEQEKKPGDPEMEQMEREAMVSQAAQNAAQQAQESVQELADAASAFGLNPSGMNKMDPAKLGPLFAKIQRDPTLRQILAMAGRYRRMAQAKQRQKKTHGYDDMVGIEVGGDVSKLVTGELAQMAAGDEMESLVLLRLIDRQAQVRKYQGIEPIAKGPILVALDESGSMSGERIIHAKSLALAMAWIAGHQKRWCCLLAWSDSGSRRYVTLPPEGWSQDELVDWLSGFFGGGTEPPLDDMPAIWKATGAIHGKTDVLMLTDAEVPIDDAKAGRFNTWKMEAKAKMHTIVVGTRNPGDMTKVSDSYHVVNRLTLDCEAVSDAMSI